MLATSLGKVKADCLVRSFAFYLESLFAPHWVPRMGAQKEPVLGCQLVTHWGTDSVPGKGLLKETRKVPRLESQMGVSLVTRLEKLKAGYLAGYLAVDLVSCLESQPERHLGQRTETTKRPTLGCQWVRH